MRPVLAKPLLRGVLHQIACGLAFVAGVLLVAVAPSARGRLAAAIYAASLVTLFGVSALYHRPTWSPPARAWMRRLDHSAIFVLIAGTYVPFAMLLPAPADRRMLTLVWACAGLGIAQSIFWVRAPKGLVVALCIAFGWLIVPYLRALQEVTELRQLLLLAAGGIIYSVGGLIYARRWPDPAPRVFGYHEVFHALTILAAVVHFIAVVAAVRRMS